MEIMENEFVHSGLRFRDARERYVDRLRPRAHGRGGTLGLDGGGRPAPLELGEPRLLWDRESGAYFGYRLEVEKKDGPRPFRVSFKPLDRGATERELKQRGACPGCPAPAPLGAGPRFPAPPLLAEGEVLTLELLANTSTGERILGVVKLSARTVSAEAMRTAAARVLEGQQAVRRAAAHVARGRYAAAAEEYRKALVVTPSDPTIHNKLGMISTAYSNPAHRAMSSA